MSIHLLKKTLLFSWDTQHQVPTRYHGKKKVKKMQDIFIFSLIFFLGAQMKRMQGILKNKTLVGMPHGILNILVATPPTTPRIS
jgi:hypothetical protein